MAKRHWYTGLRGACKVPRTLLGWWYEIKPRAFLDRYALDPDRYCSSCAKAARLALAQMSAPQAYQTEPTDRFGPLVRTHNPALAKESAPKPASRCATSGCGSYAINPGQSGRDDTSDLNLCDVCYWRKQASDTWPTPRPISEAPKDGSMVLIRLPDHDPQWTIGVFDPRKRWVDLCLAGSVVEPTHFLPLPPEVK